MPPCNSDLHVIVCLGEYHYAPKKFVIVYAPKRDLHVLLNLRSYAIACVIYMHLLDMHQLDLYVVI